MIADEPDPTWSEGTLLLIAIVGLSILCIAIAVARYGLDAMSRTRLLQSVPDPPQNARYTRFIERIDALRVTVMLLAATFEAMATVCVLHLWADATALPTLSPVPIVLTALCVPAFLVAFCRILPRVLITREPERIMKPLLPWLHALSVGLHPLVVTFVAWQRLLGRGRQIPLDESFSEEIRARVAEGEREGVVAEDTAEMIENVVEFRDVEVSEVMTPRTDVDWVKADESVMTALRLAAEKGHSRLPVGEEDSDHIIGVFYVRDVLSRLEELDRLHDLKARDLCRKPFFVPEPKSVKALLQEFRDTKVHIAIVLDEYGGTAGIITIEDILEEIVGDIDDEYDAEERLPTLTMIGRDQAHVDARAHIYEINEALDIELPESDDFDTVGGFVFATLGRIPQVGESVSHDGVTIEVLEADDRRVKRLTLTVTNRNGHGVNSGVGNASE